MANQRTLCLFKSSPGKITLGITFSQQLNVSKPQLPYDQGKQLPNQLGCANAAWLTVYLKNNLV